MAISSIFVNVKITDPKQVERFVDALEESEKNSNQQVVYAVYSCLRDLDEIRKLVRKKKEYQLNGHKIVNCHICH